MTKIQGSALPAALRSLTAPAVFEVIGDVPGFTLRNPPRHVVTVSGGVFRGHVRLDGVHGLTFVKATFAGPDTATAHIGVIAQRCTGLAFKDCAFTGLQKGVVFDLCDTFTVDLCEFSRMSSDGVNVAASGHGRITRSQFHDFVQFDLLAHPDAIQLWSRATSPPVADIVISDNKIVGNMQGIGGFNHITAGVDDGGFDRITIERNSVEVSFANGIAINAARGLVLRDNAVKTLPGAKWQARISVIQCTNVTRSGNTVAAYGGKPGLVEPPAP